LNLVLPKIGENESATKKSRFSFDSWAATLIALNERSIPNTIWLESAREEVIFPIEQPYSKTRLE
jgi:hypothetical protein